MLTVKAFQGRKRSKGGTKPSPKKGSSSQSKEDEGLPPARQRIRTCPRGTVTQRLLSTSKISQVPTARKCRSEKRHTGKLRGHPSEQTTRHATFRSQQKTLRERTLKRACARGHEGRLLADRAGYAQGGASGKTPQLQIKKRRKRWSLSGGQQHSDNSAGTDISGRVQLGSSDTGGQAKHSHTTDLPQKIPWSS